MERRGKKAKIWRIVGPRQGSDFEVKGEARDAVDLSTPLRYASKKVWYNNDWCFPYITKTQDIEYTLYLRQFKVPFSALAHVFDRSAKHYERAQL